MKIDQKVTFLKLGAEASAPASLKEVGSVSQRAKEMSITDLARPAALTLLLPSTNGDFDAARVASIREDISAGRYQVNATKISDGLLASVRDLLNHKSS